MTDAGDRLIKAAKEARDMSDLDMSAPKHEWRDIATAPDLERVLVAGWQPPHGNVRGYWWWHEDVCEGGKAIERPHAALWCRIVLPDFPQEPT